MFQQDREDAKNSKDALSSVQGDENVNSVTRAPSQGGSAMATALSSPNALEEVQPALPSESALDSAPFVLEEGEQQVVTLEMSHRVGVTTYAHLETH